MHQVGNAGRSFLQHLGWIMVLCMMLVLLLSRQDLCDQGREFVIFGRQIGNPPIVFVRHFGQLPIHFARHLTYTILEFADFHL
jgi:hypothetical protein